MPQSMLTSPFAILICVVYQNTRIPRMLFHFLQILPLCLQVIFSLKWSKRRQFEVKIRGGVDGSKGSLSFLTSSQMGTKFFSNGHQMVAHFSSNRTLSLVLPPILSTLNLCLKSWQIMFLYCVVLCFYIVLYFVFILCWLTPLLCSRAFFSQNSCTGSVTFFTKMFT